GATGDRERRARRRCLDPGGRAQDSRAAAGRGAACRRGGRCAGRLRRRHPPPGSWNSSAGGGGGGLPGPAPKPRHRQPEPWAETRAWPRGRGRAAGPAVPAQTAMPSAVRGDAPMSLGTEEDKRQFPVIGLVVTALWTLLYGAYLATRIGWSALIQLSPGEQGGLLAGYAGALALFCLFRSSLRRDGRLAANMATLEAELQRVRDRRGDAETRAASMREMLRQRALQVEAATAAADDQLAKV